MRRGLFDARLQFGEGIFGIGKGRRLDASETRDAARRLVGEDLHLLHERMHVGIEPRLKQRGGIELALLGEGRALVEHTRRGVQILQIDRHGGLVHGKRHVSLLVSMRST
jgi:hypothetical protein